MEKPEELILAELEEKPIRSAVRFEVPINSNYKGIPILIILNYDHCIGLGDHKYFPPEMEFVGIRTPEYWVEEQNSNGSIEKYFKWTIVDYLKYQFSRMFQSEEEMSNLAEFLWSKVKKIMDRLQIKMP